MSTVNVGDVFRQVSSFPQSFPDCYVSRIIADNVAILWRPYVSLNGDLAKEEFEVYIKNLLDPQRFEKTKR